MQSLEGGCINVKKFFLVIVSYGRFVCSLTFPTGPRSEEPRDLEIFELFCIRGVEC